MSTSRLQYLSDDEDEEAMEEERSFKPKVAIEISKKRYLINRPVSFNDQVICPVCCLIKIGKITRGILKAAAIMEEVMPSEDLRKEYVRSVTSHKGIQVIH